MSPDPSRPNSCIASAATSGPSIPAALLRVTAEMRSAKAVKPSAGTSEIPQAATVSPAAWPLPSVWPVSPTSGCAPVATTPAAMLAAPSNATVTSV